MAHGRVATKPRAPSQVDAWAGKAEIPGQPSGTTTPDEAHHGVGKAACKHQIAPHIIWAAIPNQETERGRPSGEGSRMRPVGDRGPRPPETLPKNGRKWLGHGRTCTQCGSPRFAQISGALAGADPRMPQLGWQWCRRRSGGNRGPDAKLHCRLSRKFAQIRAKANTTGHIGPPRPGNLRLLMPPRLVQAVSGPSDAACPRYKTRQGAGNDGAQTRG